MTEKQKSVLMDVWATNDPWYGVGIYDGRRTKLIEKLLDNGLITASYNLRLAWITRKGIATIS